MRDSSGEYALSLVYPGTSQAFPEVQGPNGETYAVAAPGQEFEVAVSWRPGYSNADGSHRMASLRVDGVNVGYSKTLTSPATCNFLGFLKAGDAHGISCQSFVLSKPVETSTKQVTGLNFTEGRLICQVFRARYTGGLKPVSRITGPASTNEAIARLPEGKKFFMAPSLTTGKGDLKASSGFSTKAYELLDGREPVAVMTLRYETAAALLLRGVLKRDNPAHRAILQQFPDTAEQDNAEGSGGNAAAPHRKASAASGHRRPRGPLQQQPPKQEPAAGGRVKRERAHGEGELVDLTQAINERDEVLRAKREDKVLECDLTAENDSGGKGRWRAVDKAVHAV